MNKTFDYWDGDTHIYVETMPNGDELVSEYGNGWQKAYSRPKALLDYWKSKAMPAPKSNVGDTNE